MKDYRRLSLVEKQALSRARIREHPVRCPGCDAATTASDLVTHVQHRCPGQQAPGPTSLWIGWRDALRMGASGRMLSFWAQRGHVRWKEGMQERRYLMRDVAMRVAVLKRRR